MLTVLSKPAGIEWCTRVAMQLCGKPNGILQNSVKQFQGFLFSLRRSKLLLEKRCSTIPAN